MILWVYIMNSQHPITTHSQLARVRCLSDITLMWPVRMAWWPCSMLNQLAEARVVGVGKIKSQGDGAPRSNGVVGRTPNMKSVIGRALLSVSGHGWHVKPSQFCVDQEYAALSQSDVHDSGRCQPYQMGFINLSRIEWQQFSRCSSFSQLGDEKTWQSAKRWRSTPTIPMVIGKVKISYAS